MEDLAAFVARRYDIPPLDRCDYLQCGLNDTYRVAAGDHQYFLRIYRKGWRQIEDVKYEIEVLSHMAQKGVPVSTAIPQKNGKQLGFLTTPEGQRMFVLFTHAPGEELSHDGDQALHYGRMVAKIHAATDDFSSRHRRFHLDLDHMLEQPLGMIRECLTDRPDHLNYLEELCEELRHRFATATAEPLDFGFCHGDTKGLNAHITDDGTVTFFDFDCGGPGWRAYDLATFRVSLLLSADDPKWHRFLDGYREVRAIAPRDFDALPLFMMLRQILIMGIMVGPAEAFLGRYYFEQTRDDLFKRLREMRDELDRTPDPVSDIPKRSSE
ncbi:MAG: phosphotransferase enzyme family protein [Candidatus Binataceae bacterium]